MGASLCCRRRRPRVPQHFSFVEDDHDASWKDADDYKRIKELEKRILADSAKLDCWKEELPAYSANKGLRRLHYAAVRTIEVALYTDLLELAKIKQAWHSPPPPPMYD